ncbi:hypothetical protein PG994_003927 [Apiospora phragmitis]|uniref:Aminoglycoside phosphotransferase domain-containing protein n=1 Tax=Apiospora phragmitis TaxID=2905665 RepID=A0ABR1W2G8_9PEZI
MSALSVAAAGWTLERLGKGDWDVDVPMRPERFNLLALHIVLARLGVVTNMEEDEVLREIHQVLHGYFENDTRSRFQLEGPIASGAESIAWGLQHAACGKACQRIVLKTPKWADLGGGEEEEESPEDDSNNAWNNESNTPDPIENERKWLSVLGWAKHVMNILEIPADPLSRRKAPLRRHGLENWIFIEWVQHGTLHRLVRRAKEESMEYLPNRLLWRFFMCPMAWPPEQPISAPEWAFEIIRQQPPLRITHGDLHSENVMIGPFEPDSEYLEYDIIPVLKMIDLGQMSGNEAASFDATKENIHDIGNVSRFPSQHPSDSQEEYTELKRNEDVHEENRDTMGIRPQGNAKIYKNPFSNLVLPWYKVIRPIVCK